MIHVDDSCRANVYHLMIFFQSFLLYDNKNRYSGRYLHDDNPMTMLSEILQWKPFKIYLSLRYNISNAKI